MKYTPDLYKQIFEMDALLQKSLKESDSDGKRRTFQGIHGFLTRYLEEINAYLKTPEPRGEPQRPYRSSTTERNRSWVHRSRNRRDELRRELNEK